MVWGWIDTAGARFRVEAVDFVSNLDDALGTVGDANCSKDGIDIGTLRRCRRGICRPFADSLPVDEIMEVVSLMAGRLDELERRVATMEGRR